jgi:hypothetical protein
VVVPGDAVGLDRDALRPPEVVGGDGLAAEAQRGVDLGARDLRLVEEVEQAVLEVRARRRGPAGDHRAQSIGAAVAV